MTKQEAIKNHRAMWNWIADEIKEAKCVLDVYEMKRQYLLSNGFLRVQNYCFLCQYSSGYGCQKCPMEWPSKAEIYMCEDDGNDLDGLWLECYNMYDNGDLDWRKQADLARQIANLPERSEGE